jgi:YHS domain-containing protein
MRRGERGQAPVPTSWQREVSALRAWPTVFVIALLAFGLGFVGGCGQAEQAEEAATHSIEQAAEGAESMMEEHMMVDPVCGREVAMGEAVTYEHEGKMYHFCCEDCLNKFKEDPAAYMTMEEEMPEKG